MEPLPPVRPGTVLRVLATNDVGAALVPVPTTMGPSGTCAGIAAGAGEPATVAVMAGFVPRVEECLDRATDGEPAPVGARETLVRSLA